MELFLQSGASFFVSNSIVGEEFPTKIVVPSRKFAKKKNGKLKLDFLPMAEITRKLAVDN